MGSRRRHRQGLCPEHGTRPRRSGACADCALEQAARDPEPKAPRQPEDPPRGNCSDCDARIFLQGRAPIDALLCRREAVDAAAAALESADPVTCSGWEGVPCDRSVLPDRTVCARHRALELAAEPDQVAVTQAR